MSERSRFSRLKPLRLSALAALACLLVPGCKSTPAPTAAPAARRQVNEAYVTGALAYQEGDKAKALESLLQAVQKNPNSIMSQMLLAAIYKEKDDYASAADRYEIVCRLDPYDYRNHYQLGLMYQYLDRLREAGRKYADALRLNPDDFESNMNLGLVYDALGQPENGLRYCRRATEIKPTSSAAWSNLAVVLDSLRQYSEAENAYRKAVELGNTRVETIANLAGNLLAQGKYSEAAVTYETVLKSMDNGAVRYRYGRALMGARRLDDAATQFNAALKQDPGNWRALNGLAEVRIAQYKASTMLDEAKRIEAVTHWKKSLQLNANQPAVEKLIKDYSQLKLFTP